MPHTPTREYPDSLSSSSGPNRDAGTDKVVLGVSALPGDRHATAPAGRIIDILAIFDTLFGSAASLGLGALQIGDGLQGQGWIESAETTLLVVIIAVLTTCFVASAVSGVARGIQWLSNINLLLTISLPLFVFVGVSTKFILDLLPTALGSYAQQAAEMASRTDASGTEEVKAWLSGWTISSGCSSSTCCSPSPPLW